MNKNEVNSEFPVSSSWQEKFNRAEHAIFIDIHSEEQETNYSCGPAVLKDVLTTLGDEIDQKEIINEARKGIREYRPKDSRKSMAELGTPPKVMEEILKNHGVEIEVKASAQQINEQALAEGESFLDQKLKEGKVIITAVQTIPNYMEERDINEDGHYIVVCGSMTVDDKKFYIVVDPMFHYYQRDSNEQSVYGMHMGSKAAEGTPKTEPETIYETADTRNIEYSAEDLEEFEVNPKNTA